MVNRTNPKILLIDDNPADLYLNRLKIAEEFPNAELYLNEGNIDQFQIQLDQHRPHLVISDHSMNGFYSSDIAECLTNYRRQTGEDIKLIVYANQEAGVIQPELTFVRKEGLNDGLIRVLKSELTKSAA